jgi:hypothetical protein
MSDAPHTEDYSGAVLTYATLCPRWPIKSRSHATPRQIGSLPLYVKQTRQTDMDQRLSKSFLILWSAGSSSSMLLFIMTRSPAESSAGADRPLSRCVGSSSRKERIFSIPLGQRPRQSILSPKKRTCPAKIPSSKSTFRKKMPVRRPSQILAVPRQYFRHMG